MSDEVKELSEMNQSLDCVENDEDTSLSISYRALANIMAPKTLKFQGIIHGKSISVLVGSGSTYRFIQTRGVKKLNLTIFLNL